MKVGLVGFAQSGKSTLFQALTGVVPDHAAAMKGQVGIAKVSDERLNFLEQMYHPKKTTPATVEFIDTPGLIRGEKGDNPQRIATLRNANGLLVVVNGFSGGSPTDELLAFREELMFADLEVVTNRIQKIEAGSKKPKPAKVKEQEERELDDLRRIAETLENGGDVRALELSEESRKTLKSFQLFSMKPEMVVINCAEDKVSEPVPQEMLELNPNTLAIAAKLELDLRELEGEEREMFMAEMGVKELAHDRVIRMAYEAVGLISFFTVGEDECKAWTIELGTSAVDAAGKIHSDIARGFIRAELCAYKDLHDLGSMKEVKAKGLQRLEGKEYVVRDGDIINFRFNV